MLGVRRAREQLAYLGHVRGKLTRASRARPGGPVGDQLKQRGAGLAARSGSSLHDARQNTCMSPRCSTDLITIEIRAPKFLDGKLPNGTRCQGCPNPGTVTSGDRCQRFTRPASQSIYLSISRADTLESILRDRCRLFENAPTGRKT